ncbi:CD276 antigen 4Ig-B7-H3 B7 -like protein 3 [Collichthys lucidus]|uniref:CD276 antigen 4Ig-B7-H3 B7-like protein 3 n=1 Tax=Collichthys lucidus TaxID=240159 RepID=A0A4U5U1N0_COLLU|nr:CD276 antigen 4Ig-B7-H3 B7 -like protein 3 [Collichthys lucidus]
MTLTRAAQVTTMASIRVFIFISTLVAAARSAGFVSVKCNTENVGQFGQQVMVDCVVQLKPEAADAEIKVVNWKNRDDKTLLEFYRGETEASNERYSFAEPSWNNKNLNVSLLISNAAVEDEGAYTCIVETDSGGDTVSTSLEIRAKYNRPTVTSTPERLSGDSDGVLTCRSEGGYPEGSLRWFDEHNAEWTKSAVMRMEKTKDGLFGLSSSLTLLRGSTFSQYTCVVYNHSGGREDEVLFEINPHNDRQGQGPGKQVNPASNIVAPVVVIGSLIVGLLILLVVRRRRNRRCSSSIDGYTGLYLYQELEEEEEEEEVLYYSEPTRKVTPRTRFMHRIQISGSLKNLTITIRNLTVDDCYKCVYRKMQHEVQCNVYSLFVRDHHVVPVVEEPGGLQEVSVLQPRPSAEPCASSPLLLIVASCIITVLIIAIFILLIILRMKQWTRSRAPTETGQTSDYVYEVMTQRGLRPVAAPQHPQPSPYDFA